MSPDLADVPAGGPTGVDPDRQPGAPGERPANIGDLLRTAASRFPHRSAVIGGGRSVTWAELDRVVDAGTADLLGAGPTIGDRVVVALPTGVDIVAALFAVARAGLVAAPTAPGRGDLAEIAARVGAAAVIATDLPPTDRMPVLGTAAIARWWDRATTVPAPDPARPGAAGAARAAGAAGAGAAGDSDEPRAGGEDLALLARAGSSARPVMLSHRAVLATVTAIGRAPGLALRSEDRVISVLPLYHPAGWVTAFLPLCAVGGTAVVPDDPEPESLGGPAAGRWIDGVLSAIRRERVTVIPAAPSLYRRLRVAPQAERALASVRLMTSGAAPLDPGDSTAVRSLIGQPVWDGYGIAESASAVSSTLMTPAPRPGSVGLPLPGIELRILADDGDDVEPADGPDRAPGPAGAPGTDPGPLLDVPGGGEVGRIALRGPTLFSGYWPDGGDGPAGDGWFVTGDVGYLDDRGELHLVDRAGESFQVAGFTVYPREVEDVLTRHPYVRDAAVVAVPDRAGESMLAVLVAQRGTRPTAADLDEWVAALLPVFKRPQRYRLVDRLPRTDVGRVDRGAVRRAYLDDPDLDATLTLRVAAGQPAGAGPEPGRAGAAPGPAAPVKPARAGGGVPTGGAGTGSRATQDDDEDLF